MHGHVVVALIASLALARVGHAQPAPDSGAVPVADEGVDSPSLSEGEGEGEGEGDESEGDGGNGEGDGEAAEDRAEIPTPAAEPAPDDGGAGVIGEPDAGPGIAPTISLEATPDGEPEVAGSQELGARVGMAAGKRTTPGGLYLAGTYLYQLSRQDWFEGGLAFSVGSGDADCFRDRQDQLLCDHGIAAGVAIGLSVGVRRFLATRQSFTPYLHAGLDLRYVSFSSDEVRGIALPLWLGAGVRARVGDGVAIAGGARYQAGISWFNRDLGIEPQSALIIIVGVDFRLD